MFEQIEVNSERWFDLSLLKNEKWKPLIMRKKNILYDYTNLYEISNYGRIKSLGIYHGKTNNYFLKPHIIKANKNKWGYNYYCLRKFGESNYVTVHRIVAQVFIPNLENKPQVNHISGIKTDNRICNLEWCTASENVKHAYNMGLKVSKGRSMSKEKNPNCKHTEQEINEIRKKRKNGYKLKDLAKEYNINESYICAICKYKFWN